MNTYRVTDDQGGESDQQASDPETAAEQHAESQYHGNDHFDALNVVVETPEGPLAFKVAAEFTVSFLAVEAGVSVDTP